jgi:hypothetical protein
MLTSHSTPPFVSGDRRAATYALNCDTSVSILQQYTELVLDSSLQLVEQVTTSCLPPLPAAAAKSPKLPTLEGKSKPLAFAGAKPAAAVESRAVTLDVKVPSPAAAPAAQFEDELLEKAAADVGSRALNALQQSLVGASMPSLVVCVGLFPRDLQLAHTLQTKLVKLLKLLSVVYRQAQVQLLSPHRLHVLLTSRPLPVAV